MSEIVKLREVLRRLRLEPGDITVCTYDEKRGTGGKRKFYKGVMLTGTPTDQNAAALPSGSGEGSDAKRSVNPHFRANATTNIRTRSGKPVTIHPILIEQYNGKRVTP